MLENKRILLIVSGGIAAVKTPDLVRRLKERGASVRCVLTKAAEQFVTPLSLASLSGEKALTHLFDLTDETEIGHIQLSREADVVLVAPATADIMARMAAGLADDLATTALLATDKPVLIAPSMNVMMWTHPATQANLKTLLARDVTMIPPGVGDMACGEVGEGRMAEVADIIAALEGFFRRTKYGKPLRGRKALVTSGPTREPIDPVRFIANHSSGRQGHAIAGALADLGAEVTLISGPVSLPDPQGMKVVHIQTAEDMLAACKDALPSDIAVCCAAVADWRLKNPAGQKMKKNGKATTPRLELTENPDILATLSKGRKSRPTLVVGFAAETENVIKNAQAKLKKKSCDWIVANDVSTGSGTFGGADNTVHLITKNGTEDWPRQSKQDVARNLALRIAEHLADMDTEPATNTPSKKGETRS